MWPGAHLLAQYLHAEAVSLPIHHPESAACELGAGAGLTSLLCARHCPVVATDHSEEVLDLLRQNIELNPTPHSVRCGLLASLAHAADTPQRVKLSTVSRAMALDWGSNEQLQAVLAVSPGRQVLQACLPHGPMSKLTSLQCRASRWCSAQM